ncbi:MAG: fibronectin type III domain-containing protein, partial [Candidatus Aenigmarchaeota archaeon]|nr:fibronectin type III domain-containing protein [Candidatus Aenigmarchaeota archaeon]
MTTPRKTHHSHLKLPVLVLAALIACQVLAIQSASAFYINRSPLCGDPSIIKQQNYSLKAKVDAGSWTCISGKQGSFTFSYIPQNYVDGSNYYFLLYSTTTPAGQDFGDGMIIGATMSQIMAAFGSSCSCSGSYCNCPVTGTWGTNPNQFRCTAAACSQGAAGPATVKVQERAEVRQCTDPNNLPGSCGSVLDQSNQIEWYYLCNPDSVSGGCYYPYYDVRCSTDLTKVEWVSNSPSGTVTQTYCGDAQSHSVTCCCGLASVGSAYSCDSFYVKTAVCTGTEVKKCSPFYDNSGAYCIKEQTVSMTSSCGGQTCQNNACPADTTPPVRSGGSPTGSLPAGTTQRVISLSTDETSTCKYSTTANTAYSSMANTFSTTGATYHSTTVTGLANGQSYNYYVRCSDVAGNANTNDYAISFSVANLVDTTPPVRSGGFPTGSLPAGTTQTPVSLTTNEASTCKYSLNTANTPYSSMANQFVTTGGTAHSMTVVVANGQSYNYYVRCSDVAGNANTNDYAISFSVANTPDNTPPQVFVTANPATVDTTWQKATATAGVSCSDTGTNPSGCKADSYRLLVSATLPITCPNVYDTAVYAIPTSSPITSHSWVCVAGKDLAGNANFSYPMEFRVDQLAPAASIGYLPLWANQTSFNVSWSGTDEGGSGIAYFGVQYRDDSGNWANWLTAISTQNSYATFNTGMNNHTYSFRVNATDAAGNSGQYSSPASTTVDTAKPTCAIQDMPAYQSSSDFMLIWSGADGESGVKEYIVEQRTASLWMQFHRGPET